MPIGGIREAEVDTVGNSYRKDPLYPYAEAFKETAQNILNEDGCDIFEEPTRVYRRRSSKNAMKKFFCEGMFDKDNALLDPQDVADQQAMAETQFENDAQAISEHAAPADYSPMVGMAL